MTNMTTGSIIVQALPLGKRLYLDANVVIYLMHYAITERDKCLREWSKDARKLIRSIIQIVEAGAYQMRRARAGEIREAPGPRMYSSILSFSQAAHAFQLYRAMDRRITNRVPYRELTDFRDIIKDVSPNDLKFTDEALTYFSDTWLLNRNLRSAIVIYPSRADPGGSDTDLSVCFEIGRELSKYAYLDPEDALHLSTAIITRCTDFVSTDKPLRDAIDLMLKTQECQDQLHKMKADWELPRPLKPKTPGILSQLGWILPPAQVG